MAFLEWEDQFARLVVKAGAGGGGALFGPAGASVVDEVDGAQGVAAFLQRVQMLVLDYSDAVRSALLPRRGAYFNAPGDAPFGEVRIGASDREGWISIQQADTDLNLFSAAMPKLADLDQASVVLLLCPDRAKDPTEGEIFTLGVGATKLRSGDDVPIPDGNNVLFIQCVRSAAQTWNVQFISSTDVPMVPISDTAQQLDYAPEALMIQREGTTYRGYVTRTGQSWDLIGTLEGAPFVPDRATFALGKSTSGVDGDACPIYNFRALRLYNAANL
jgi:hypothetical protein